MRDIEEKRNKINSFIAMCEKSSGENPPSELSYQDISKIVSERYSTQAVETIKVYFRTKGKTSNNTPYVYPEELPIGTATIISDDLLDARTIASIGYGEIVDKPREIKPKSDYAHLEDDEDYR